MEEQQDLDEWIRAEAPASGSNPADQLPREVTVNPQSGHKPYSGVTRFDQLPLSNKTLRALRESDYHDMTRIQRAVIPHALCGRDVLGVAESGNGKTLASLVPVVENLYRLRSCGSDQVAAALIISPTEEMARESFQVLRELLKYHDLTVGLLTDDVNLGLSILVATPGTLLQRLHQGTTLDFQIVVLDEADQILDDSIADMTHILAALPKKRQTLLFSATQKTRSVDNLARLSFQQHPEYLVVRSDFALAAPSRLRERVLIMPLHSKIQALWSFIITRLESKILVFFSTCSQVKFVYKAFSALRPGVPLACIHARLTQEQRNSVFENFEDSRASVLFVTDAAARGLDFRPVDWVVQADCPANVQTYVRRAGRSARQPGSSVLFLDPSEERMVSLLKNPVHKVLARMTGDCNMSQCMAALVAKDPGMKRSAQRAFSSYVRSILEQKNKRVFYLDKLAVNEFALSLGLPSAPRIRGVFGAPVQKRRFKLVGEEDVEMDDGFI